ncbi:SusC/RagA family TonB-linked outer membrane protein [Pedobacter sp. UC225_61]|uniref:SusC/RagA family TonB-linked outer membrane protein n=1 Tax=Pedobacter sp. UC225_61 TaxID=3374623 RepID=UPI0037A7E428
MITILEKSYNYQNNIIGDAAPSGSQSKTAYNATTLTLTQLLNYKKTLAERHNFSALLGHENYYLNSRVLSGNKTGIIALGINELDNFTTIGGLTSYQDTYKMESVFGEVKYNLDQKYFISATLRRDASSKFASDKRWGNFWSAGAAWLINEESFMKSINWIDQLKLRASYGETGSDGSAYYGWQSLYNIKPNNTVPAYYLAAAANPALSWETNKTADIALEFSLFKNRLRGSVEAYKRASSNLIFNVPLPANAGTTSITRNIGTMYNKGIEFDLTVTPVKVKDFTWDFTLNGSVFKNEITKMPTETPTIISGTKQYKVGQSIYQFWLRQWVGVDPQTGSSIYLDDASTAGNTIYTTDINRARFDYSGSAIPDISGGIKNVFTYKSLSLSSILSYSLGGKFYDSNYSALMAVNSSYGKSFHQDVLNRWQKPGDITNVPRVDDTDATNLNAGTSTRWLVDNNFLVLRNITLAYTIPVKYVSKLKLSRINVFASGDNLLYLTPRKGLDPTTSFSGTNSSSYIPSRIFSFGANVSF